MLRPAFATASSAARTARRSSPASASAAFAHILNVPPIEGKRSRPDRLLERRLNRVNPRFPQTARLRRTPPRHPQRPRARSSFSIFTFDADRLLARRILLRPLQDDRTVE